MVDATLKEGECEGKNSHNVINGQIVNAIMVSFRMHSKNVWILSLQSASTLSEE